MSTDTVNHLTRKAAGKIRIIKCSNMQGRRSVGQRHACTDSSEPTDSGGSNTDQTAEEMEFQPLTLEATTEAVGFLLCLPKQREKLLFF